MTNYLHHAYRANRHVYDNPNIRDRGFQQHLAIQEAEKILEADPAVFIGEGINEHEDEGEALINGCLKLLDKLPQRAIPEELLGVYDDLLVAREKLIEGAKLPYAQKRYPELF